MEKAVAIRFSAVRTHSTGALHRLGVLKGLVGCLQGVGIRCRDNPGIVVGCSHLEFSDCELVWVGGSVHMVVVIICNPGNYNA